MPRRNSRIKEDEGHHEHVHDESNWLVSYADMMTLLFGFFVLMYSFSKVDESKFKVIRKELVNYFGGTVREDATIKKIEKVKKDIETVVSQGGVDQFIDISISDYQISLRFDGEILFRSGSAQLVPSMAPVLTKIVDVLKDQKGVNLIEVEGHTDDDPIYSPVFPTNWELSAARATRVVRQFEASGFLPKILIAKGLGSSRPIVPNRSERGLPIEENQAKNRRVIINVEYVPDPVIAREVMESNQFRVPSSKDPKESKRPEFDSPTIDSAQNQHKKEEDKRTPEEILADRMEQAKERIEALRREKQKKEKLMKLRERVKKMEQQALELEKSITKEPGSRIPANKNGKDSPKEPLSRQQGLTELERLKNSKSP